MYEYAGKCIGKTDLFDVRQSQIHGLGLFAKRDIIKNTIVTFYDGERIDWKEANNLPDKRYLRTVAHGHEVIDGIKMRIDGFGAGSLINHSNAPNCIFIVRNDNVWVKAKRGLLQDEEMTVNYGRGYWNRP